MTFYKTRIVCICKGIYFVEYKWIGPFLKGLFHSQPIMTWKRFNRMAYTSLNDAKKQEKEARESYRLNYLENRSNCCK